MHSLPFCEDCVFISCITLAGLTVLGGGNFICMYRAHSWYTQHNNSNCTSNSDPWPLRKNSFPFVTHCCRQPWNQKGDRLPQDRLQSERESREGAQSPCHLGFCYSLSLIYLQFLFHLSILPHLPSLPLTFSFWLSKHMHFTLLYWISAVFFFLISKGKHLL